jgi:hypothetical protein
MSSGSVGDFSIKGQQFQGTGDFRTWSGDDGKYDTTPLGTQRSKWNNYTLYRGWRRRTSNVWVATKASDGSTFTSYADVKCAFSAPHSEALRLQAQSRLAEKVRGHSFNLAVNAAQSRQLTDMVVGNLGKFGRSVLALKRGDFATAARHLGTRPRPTKLKPSDVSGRWLELQYGWLPALSDTWEAAKAYEELTKKERVSTVHSSAKDKLIQENHVSGNWASSKETVVRRVAYTYEMREKLDAYRSLGLMDPLSVAWEIIPYSFVVDWFIPIGTYLDTLSIIPILEGRWMETRSWVVTGNEPLVYTASLPAWFGGHYCSDVRYTGTDSTRGVYVERRVSAGPPRVAFPSFDRTGLRGTRIWNAIALAAQRFLI